jgi:hypothetical protein
VNPWGLWEDWTNGFYVVRHDPSRIEASASLLADKTRFANAARLVLEEWPNAAIHNLNHMWSGRRAWLGQAACLHSHGAVAAETRTAWGQLSNRQQSDANRTAESVIIGWRGHAQARLAL